MKFHHCHYKIDVEGNFIYCSACGEELNVDDMKGKLESYSLLIAHFTDYLLQEVDDTEYCPCGGEEVDHEDNVGTDCKGW